ncbi:MAG: nucleotidyltransferase substrate binding protein [Synergistaceae bacterium]|jgi:nucleotidyltransferase substrate binding protein (TIGR01987 family)|nr:nucleotidyltransferase substrate binding protein [Synergistaceae bacterium]
MNCENFRKALWHLRQQYENYSTLSPEQPSIMREAVAESVVQRFETCYDCMWKVLRRYLMDELGLPAVPNSPKPVLRIAGENGLFDPSHPVEAWMKYADARVSTSHDYSGAKALNAIALTKNFIADAEALLSFIDEKIAVKLDVSDEQLRTILAILEQHLPGAAAWAYGSRVYTGERSSGRVTSDFDMVVFVTPDRRHALPALRDAFEASGLPFRVDLFSWDEIPDDFKDNIRAKHFVLKEAEEG